MKSGCFALGALKSCADDGARAKRTTARTVAAAVSRTQRAERIMDICGLLVFHRQRLAPHVPFVVVNFVLLQESAILVLKGTRFVMRALVRDVGTHVRRIGLADSKC